MSTYWDDGECSSGEFHGCCGITVLYELDGETHKDRVNALHRAEEQARDQRKGYVVYSTTANQTGVVKALKERKWHKLTPKAFKNHNSGAMLTLWGKKLTRKPYNS